MTKAIQLLNWKLRCAKYNPPKYPLMHPYFIRGKISRVLKTIGIKEFKKRNY